MSNADALHDASLRTAVAWKVRHESAPLDAAQRAAFERWLAEAANHRQAWSRVAGALEAPLSTLNEYRAQGGASHFQAVRQALLTTRRRRRSMLRGALAVAGMGTAVAWVADRQAPLGQITADLRTGTGERRSIALANGATALLDARSALDLDAVARPPRVTLRAGALIVSNVAPGAGPLSLATPYVRTLLDDARLMFRLHPGATEVVALDGSALLTAADGRTTWPLAVGEGVFATGSGPWQPLPGRPQERAAWRDGMLAADDWPLADVVEAIRPYFAGHIRLDPAAAGLRVFGVFRLQIDDVLAALVQALPVAVRRIGPWLVSIEKDR